MRVRRTQRGEGHRLSKKSLVTECNKEVNVLPSLDQPPDCQKLLICQVKRVWLLHHISYKVVIFLYE